MLLSPRLRQLKIVVFVMLIASTSALGLPLGSFGVGVGAVPKCEPSVTTASGSYIPLNKATFCSGDLIFEDTFDTFDIRKWQHENTLSGGGVSYLYLVPL